VRPEVSGWVLVVCSLVSCAPSSRSAVGAERVESPGRFPQLVSTDQLARWQKTTSVSVVDVRSEVESYLKGHLPGAVYLNPETLRASERGVPAQLLSARSYQELFSGLGVSFDAPVVIYSAGETRNIDATFVAWLLAGFGHPRVYLLDGGFFKWQLEQYPVVRQYPRVDVTDFSASFRPERASLEEVREAVERGSATLVDARPPEQYSGQAGAQMRRGHIPGAINHHWKDDLTREGFGHVWKNLATLRQAYVGQRIRPERSIIVYCNSSTEASHVHFALRYLLGYPRVRIYVGSWTEWAGRAELPIEVGSRVPAQ
jgi:thiosulfate/3-mercaptopyruvate sulfurtransferase